MREAYSQEAIKRINIILKLVKNQLKTDVFSTDDKVEAIETALTSFNSAPPFTNISFEDKECDKFQSGIAGEAVTYLENRLKDRELVTTDKPVDKPVTRVG